MPKSTWVTYKGVKWDGQNVVIKIWGDNASQCGGAMTYPGQGPWPKLKEDWDQNEGVMTWTLDPQSGPFLAARIGDSFVPLAANQSGPPPTFVFYLSAHATSLGSGAKQPVLVQATQGGAVLKASLLTGELADTFEIEGHTVTLILQAS